MEILFIVIMSLCILWCMYCIDDTITSVRKGQKIYYPILTIMGLITMIILLTLEDLKKYNLIDLKY